MSIKIKIKITKEILQRSAYCETNKVNGCAFALAVRDIFPEGKVQQRGIVPTEKAWKEWWNDHYSASTPSTPMEIENIRMAITEDMVAFIKLFDMSSPEERKDFPEQEFELEIPDWALQLIGSGELEETKKIISQSKTLELCQ